VLRDDRWAWESVVAIFLTAVSQPAALALPADTDWRARACRQERIPQSELRRRSPCVAKPSAARSLGRRTPTTSSLTQKPVSAQVLPGASQRCGATTRMSRPVPSSTAGPQAVVRQLCDSTPTSTRRSATRCDARRTCTAPAQLRSTTATRATSRCPGSTGIRLPEHAGRAHLWYHDPTASRHRMNAQMGLAGYRDARSAGAVAAIPQWRLRRPTLILRTRCPEGRRPRPRRQRPSGSTARRDPVNGARGRSGRSSRAVPLRMLHAPSLACLRPRLSTTTAHGNRHRWRPHAAPSERLHLRFYVAERSRQWSSTLPSYQPARANAENRQPPTTSEYEHTDVVIVSPSRSGRTSLRPLEHRGPRTSTPLRSWASRRRTRSRTRRRLDFGRTDGACDCQTADVGTMWSHSDYKYVVANPALDASRSGSSERIGGWFHSGPLTLVDSDRDRNGRPPLPHELGAMTSSNSASARRTAWIRRFDHRAVT
jgi:hypothetical protein